MFVQRAIISLLYPYEYRHCSLHNAARVYRAVSTVLINSSFRNLVIALFMAGRHVLTLGQSGEAMPLQGLINAVGINNVVSQDLRTRIGIVALVLGLIGRIGMFLSWSMMLHVVTGVLYVFLKSMNYSLFYIERIWDMLPLFVQNYFVNVQSVVIENLSQLHKETVKPITFTVWAITIIKTITYFDGWDFLFEFIGNLGWHLNNLYYVNTFINLITNNFLILWIWNLHEWAELFGIIFWVPLNWIIRHSYAREIFDYLFIIKDFFIFRWTINIIRWVRNLF